MECPSEAGAALLDKQEKHEREEELKLLLAQTLYHGEEIMEDHDLNSISSSLAISSSSSSCSSTSSPLLQEEEEFTQLQDGGKGNQEEEFLFSSDTSSDGNEENGIEDTKIPAIFHTPLTSLKGDRPLLNIMSRAASTKKQLFTTRETIDDNSEKINKICSSESSTITEEKSEDPQDTPAYGSQAPSEEGDVFSFPLPHKLPTDTKEVHLIFSQVVVSLRASEAQRRHLDLQVQAYRKEMNRITQQLHDMARREKDLEEHVLLLTQSTAAASTCKPPTLDLLRGQLLEAARSETHQARVQAEEALQARNQAYEKCEDITKEMESSIYALKDEVARLASQTAQQVILASIQERKSREWMEKAEKEMTKVGELLTQLDALKDALRESENHLAAERKAREASETRVQEEKEMGNAVSDRLRSTQADLLETQSQLRMVTAQLEAETKARYFGGAAMDGKYYMEEMDRLTQGFESERKSYEEEIDYLRAQLEQHHPSVDHNSGHDVELIALPSEAPSPTIFPPSSLMPTTLSSASLPGEAHVQQQQQESGQLHEHDLTTFIQAAASQEGEEEDWQVRALEAEAECQRLRLHLAYCQEQQRGGGEVGGGGLNVVEALLMERLEQERLRMTETFQEELQTVVASTKEMVLKEKRNEVEEMNREFEAERERLERAKIMAVEEYRSRHEEESSLRVMEWKARAEAFEEHLNQEMERVAQTERLLQQNHEIQESKCRNAMEMAERILAAKNREDVDDILSSFCNCEGGGEMKSGEEEVEDKSMVLLPDGLLKVLRAMHPWLLLLLSEGEEGQQQHQDLRKSVENARLEEVVEEVRMVMEREKKDEIKALKAQYESDKTSMLSELVLEREARIDLMNRLKDLQQQEGNNSFTIDEAAKLVARAVSEAGEEFKQEEEKRRAKLMERFAQEKESLTQEVETHWRRRQKELSRKVKLLQGAITKLSHKAQLREKALVDAQEEIISKREEFEVRQMEMKALIDRLEEEIAMKTTRMHEFEKRSSQYRKQSKDLLTASSRSALEASRLELQALEERLRAEHEKEIDLVMHAMRKKYKKKIALMQEGWQKERMKVPPMLSTKQQETSHKPKSSRASSTKAAT